MLQNATGATMPSLSQHVLKALAIRIASLPEQRAIATVLSSLDEKIDFLNRQNKTLDALAETIFRQWFVEEATDDWEVANLSMFAAHVKQNVKPASNPTGEYTHYSIPAFDDGMSPVIEFGSEILSNKYWVTSFSILVSKLNPRFPRIWPVGEIEAQNAICSTEFQVFRPRDFSLFGFVYYFLKSQEARDELMMAASGTSGSHQRVRPEDISNLKCVFPSRERLEQYSSLVVSNINRCSANLHQIRTLEKLRDALLPKLMSGEMRVGYDG